ncbi:JAB domain-containing protein [Cyclobacterium sp.]|uniref:JAB domain-containing protein n=1 Tax=Cyclobacterium sp. TaxID=1966343 RepID=UPI00198C9CAC|nr:JAB domain-containing protein [Cyclobacterium sp.]MBD3627607.1 JAB domain-containing protein [Cyclobacterium sp.]
MKNSAQLQIFNTIGEAKVSYRTTGQPYAKVSSSIDVNGFLYTIWDHDTIEYTESFCVLSINRANKIIAYRFVSTGGTAAVIVDPKTIFQFGLLTNANALILAHNHPSGNLKPSHADLKITKKLVSGGQFIDMPILDHLIITKEGYYSLADEGQI